MKLSYSAVRDFRHCQQLYHFRRVDRLRKRATAKPLYIGSLTHEIIELYLKGERMSPRLAEIQAEYDQLWEEEQELYGDVPGLLRGIAKAYKETYPDDPEMTEAVELEFELPIARLEMPFEDDMILTGKIDWLMRDSRGLWVIDHKTTKGQIPNEGFRIFDLQTALYAWAAGELGYKNISGIGFNYIRTKEPRIPKLNKDGSMSKRKINTDIDTLTKFMRKHRINPDAYPEQLERAKQFKRFDRKFLPKPQKLIDTLLEELIITGNDIARYLDDPSPAKNLRKECEYCEFYNLCLAQLMDLDVDYLLKAEYIIKPPKDEEIDEEEEGGESTDDED